MKKPRKRLTQTLADKSACSGPLCAWREILGTYVYNPDPNVEAQLVEHGGAWAMNVVIGGQKYHGERPTLEEAFKATANLIYKHERRFWLNMDARVVTKDFEDFLKGEC